MLKRTDDDEQNPEFLFNWLRDDEGSFTLMWISHIGPKYSAKNNKYTFKVRKDKKSKDYLLESTRRCVPCDLSQEQVKDLRCAVTLDKELLEDAKHKDEDGDGYIIFYDLIIHD